MKHTRLSVIDMICVVRTACVCLLWKLFSWDHYMHPYQIITDIYIVQLYIRITNLTLSLQQKFWHFASECETQRVRSICFSHSGKVYRWAMATFTMIIQYVPVMKTIDLTSILGRQRRAWNYEARAKCNHTYTLVFYGICVDLYDYMRADKTNWVQ